MELSGKLGTNGKKSKIEVENVENAEKGGKKMEFRGGVMARMSAPLDPSLNPVLIS